ncbi:MAG: type II toxin-antitoxin system prevent-host-death family antitoxin [Actinomycetota bacterium]|nr:type II toxin-antitoxin system prevent-host-death family antitoxin [Actinomycetota bacterium]
MTNVATRELRNDTAGVLRRVQAGEEIVITVKGEPVAQLVPIRPVRRRWITTEELLERLSRIPHDPTFAEDLKWISDGTTDELGPIR